MWWKRPLLRFLPIAEHFQGLFLFFRTVALLQECPFLGRQVVHADRNFSELTEHHLVSSDSLRRRPASVWLRKLLAGRTGLEPATSSVTGKRSNQVDLPTQNLLVNCITKSIVCQSPRAFRATPTYTQPNVDIVLQV